MLPWHINMRWTREFPPYPWSTMQCNNFTKDPLSCSKKRNHSEILIRVCWTMATHDVKGNIASFIISTLGTKLCASIPLMYQTLCKYAYDFRILEKLHSDALSHNFPSENFPISTAGVMNHFSSRRISSMSNRATWKWKWTKQKTAYIEFLNVLKSFTLYPNKMCANWTKPMKTTKKTIIAATASLKQFFNVLDNKYVVWLVSV